MITFNPKLNAIEAKLKTLNQVQFRYITWQLFGWMSQDTADNTEYIDAMTRLLDGYLFKKDGK